MEISDIVMIVFALICVAFFMYYFRSTRHLRTYVYPKTGVKYIVLDYIKVKDFHTGQWNVCVLYESIKTGDKYAREYYDFYNKFVLLKDWKNEDK